MSSKKLAKKVLITTLSASMVLPFGSAVYANTQALPNGTIVTENGVGYLKDSNGEKYSGWFFDSNDEWYYFNETNKAMKKGWHHDDKDGYWYYLNSSNGKMATGWQKIDGKEYFFQPVRDMGNYHFNNEQEKWLYSMNSKVPYGAMYASTTTPDGFKVDGSGAKVAEETAAQSGNTNASSGTQTTKNGWVSENGSWHYYESGTLAKNKWLNLDGKWYYVLADGAMVSNTWKEIGGKSYYFGSDGTMYVNTTTPDGTTVDSNGLIIIDTQESINKNTNINYKDFIGTFGGEGVEQISDRPWWVGYFNISEIKDNTIYGTFERYYEVSYFADFTQGVKLIDDTFTINMNFDDCGKFALRNGLTTYENITDTFIVTCKLVYKNEMPIIIVDGQSNKYYPSPEENLKIRGFSSEEMSKFIISE